MNEQSLEYLKGLLAIFTLEVKQIIWTDKSSGICPSDVIFLSYVLSLTCSSQWANPLGKIVFPDGQILYQMICSSRNLFIPFAHQTIYSSVTVCSSRRFVRPLVWKKPFRLFNTDFGVSSTCNESKLALPKPCTDSFKMEFLLRWDKFVEQPFI